MRRREFLGVLGGMWVPWPRMARAQQRMPRIGVLMSTAADDPQAPVLFASFLQGLQELGWSDGRNLRIDVRFGAGDIERYRPLAAELVALMPDVMVASNTSTARALQQVTHTVPIVFASATDPVGGGLVASLARPGGNITGFAAREYGLSAKWLELLKEIAPEVQLVSVLRNPITTGAAGQFGAIQSVAPALGVELNPIDLRDANEIERAITALPQSSKNGLIVVATALAVVHRDRIIKLAARYRLPAVYPLRVFVAQGGLLSYGADIKDEYRRSATYVHRILKGEKPADLPVQAATKYELVINLKTAKALGLTVLPSLLARADEVIE